MKLTRADDELHRLAFAITGLALQVFLGRDVIQAIRPRLIGSPPAINQTALRLAGFAQSMVEGERVRRKSLSVSNSAVKTSKTARKPA